jgi:GxxExxY protein
MPVACPIDFQHLTGDEFARLDYSAMAHAFATHREIGRLGDETIYQRDFAARLESAGYLVHREVPVTVSFHTFRKTYFLDLTVAAQAVYELKAVSELNAEHEAQLLNYLLILDLRRGKLVNFRTSSVKAVFVNAPLTMSERRAFEVSAGAWAGDRAAMEWMLALLRDLGTGLEVSLYLQAMIHHLGGDVMVTRQLQMTRDRIPLGPQRFHLMDPDSAFRITAFESDLRPYEQQIRRLLTLSPLRAIHWINIARGRVTFATVLKE